MISLLEVWAISTISIFITLYLAKLKTVGAVRASCIIAMVGPTVDTISPSLAYEFSSVLYGASFIGMTQLESFKPDRVLISAIIYSILFVFLGPKLKGIGGALGLSAFLSVSFTCVIFKFFGNKPE